MKIKLICALFLCTTSFYNITFTKKSSQANVQDNVTSIKLLNQLLSNESVLLMQTLNYHWNLEGPEFHDYHLLFDKQYNQLFADMDKIAERVRALKGHAIGSFHHVLQHATLQEDTNKTTRPKQMIQNLTKQYEMLIAEIKDAIARLNDSSKDFGTVNFLEELITQHEKTAWMLRSLIKK
ncbi:DNA starvation/stationary phase protection protein [Candidatus Babeliales bacterium]|nr:DNA starvation/stationary phase protection protein [Candidatus Babeliales bacterium]